MILAYIISTAEGLRQSQDSFADVGRMSDDDDESDDEEDEAESDMNEAEKQKKLCISLSILQSVKIQVFVSF